MVLKYTPKKKTTVRRRRYAKKTLASSRRVSQKRYVKTMKVSKTLRNFSELKLHSSRLVEKGLSLVAPVATRPQSIFTMNTGQSINALDPDFFSANALDAFLFPRGDQANQRDGDYMYLRRLTGKIEIEATPVSGGSSASVMQNNNLECRLIAVKANRKYNRYGAYPIANTTLFMSPGGGEFGWRSPDVGGVPMLFEFQHQPINKRRWLVYCDKKFVLQPAVVEGTVISGADVSFSTNGRHPQKRVFNLNMPVNRKVHFEGDRPEDLDTQMLIILLVQRQVRDAAGTTLPPAAGSIRVNYVGTTSAYDN